MSYHVIYARKSTESEDRQVLSIDSQVRELQAIAARRGLPVAEVMTEARSAKAPGRPIFGALMRRVRRGQIRGIVCWKMDRLARNHLDTGVILQALADGQLEEVVTSDRTYTRDGNDRFMGNFELGMATKYIDDLRANVRRGNRARFLRGWVNYLPPLGYMNDLATKTIVKDPARFDLVRRIWDLFLTGAMRPEQILKAANDEWGFQTRTFKRMGGRPLGRSTLYRMLSDPFYAGIIRLRSGETFAGAHPPMITKGEFDRAQALLGRPGRPRPKHHEFSYTGILRCGACGGAITAEQHVKPSGRTYVYYRCSRHKLGTTCREPAIPESAVEDGVLGMLERIVIPRRTLSWVLTRVHQSLEAEAAHVTRARHMLEESLAAADREMDNLLSLRLRDLISDETFVARKRVVDNQRVEIQARLTAPPRTREEVAELTAATFRFAAGAAAAFRSGSRVQKRTIVETVCLNPTLKARKLAFSLRNPFSFLETSGGRLDWCATADDVRTWIAANTEYFAVPDLAEQPDDVTLPSVVKTGKEG